VSAQIAIPAGVDIHRPAFASKKILPLDRWERGTPVLLDEFHSSGLSPGFRASTRQLVSGAILRMSIKHLMALTKHPRTFVDSLLTYPRFLGAMKPVLLAQGSADMEAQLACASKGWWPAVLKYPVGQRILALMKPLAQAGS